MKGSLSKETVSDSSSFSEGEQDSRPSKKDKIAKSKNPAKNVRQSSSTSSSEASSSEEEEEDEDESSAPEPEASKPSSRKRVTIQEENAIVPLPSKAFKPPSGFQFVQKSSSQPSDISQVLSNLDGKEIWHVAAPVGVPVSSIESLALSAIQKGDPVLTHQGTAYRLHENRLVGAEKEKTLLVPDKNGNVYRRQSRPITKTFQLEQVVQIPLAGSFQANGPVDVATLARKPPKQPRHLRMRYKPFGSGDQQQETIGTSDDDESETAESQFKQPRGADLDRQHKRRKQEMAKEPPGSSEEAVASSKPESPKKKQTLPIREDSESKKAKKATTKGADDTPRGDSPEARKKSSKKHREETEEERKARRDEKRRKKRAQVYISNAHFATPNQAH